MVYTHTHAGKIECVCAAFLNKYLATRSKGPLAKISSPHRIFKGLRDGEKFARGVERKLTR